MSSIVALRAAGAALVILALVMVVLGPNQLAQLPDGMRTPILALELARSPSEVEAMLGPVSSQRDAWVQALRRSALLDYGLLLAYGALCAFAARALDTAPARRRELQAARVLAWLAPGADALENLCLLAILDGLGGEYARALTLLAWATWSKWLALGLCCACLSPALFSRGKLASVAGGAGIAALCLVAPAFVWRGLYAEAMLATIGVCQVGVWLWSLRESPVAHA